MLLIGPTGVGKSVLLALLAMAWTALKDEHVRCIDLDYSSFVAAYALGTDYRDRGNEGTRALCPPECVGSSDEEDQFLLASCDCLFARWQTDSAPRISKNWHVGRDSLPARVCAACAISRARCRFSRYGGFSVSTPNSAP